jgi:hypothetical protein
MEQMVAPVKTTAWGGLHGLLALVLDDVNYTTIRCGARQCGSKCYPTLPLLRVIFVPFFTYDGLVMSRVHPQQHKQQTNTTTMVMEPLAPPAAWIQ